MSKRIAIVGGGIGGLSAALLLLQRGFDVQVYERAPELLEVGAGLQMGPNAVRIIQSMGLSEELARVASEPPYMASVRWQDGSRISVRRTDNAREVYGAPYYTVHRGELLSLLLQAIPPERVHVSHTCVGVAQDGDEVRLDFENGRQVVADIVIGADGIHSVIRAAIVGPDKPLFSGFCAYRGMIPIERFQKLGEEDLAAVWFGPGSHLVQYPISSGTMINFVGVVTEPNWTRESWYDTASKEEYLAYFDGWHPRLKAILNEVDESKLMKWALYERAPLPYWHKGRIALLGDAAHAMLPFMGQGAAQAIEDGAILARCLAAFPEAETALAAYERIRRPRATKVQQIAHANGVTYHLEDGEAQRQRDERTRAAHETKNSIFAYDALTVPLDPPEHAAA
jgi:salicylate hydroxylase